MGGLSARGELAIVRERRRTEPVGGWTRRSPRRVGEVPGGSGPRSRLGRAQYLVVSSLRGVTAWSHRTPDSYRPRRVTGRGARSMADGRRRVHPRRPTSGPGGRRVDPSAGGQPPAFTPARAQPPTSKPGHGPGHRDRGGARRAGGGSASASVLPAVRGPLQSHESTERQPSVGVVGNPRRFIGRLPDHLEPDLVRAGVLVLWTKRHLQFHGDGFVADLRASRHAVSF